MSTFSVSDDTVGDKHLVRRLQAYPPPLMSSKTTVNGTTRAETASGLGEVSKEEKLRRRRLRQMARKTPEQRRRALQYQRRHSEKDGSLVYCDYCDLFVSAREKPLEKHMGSWKHMDAVEAYWSMAALAEPLWMKEIRDGVQQAWGAAQARRQQRVHGIGAAVPMPCRQVAPDVHVGGARVGAAVTGSPPPATPKEAFSHGVLSPPDAKPES